MFTGLLRTMILYILIIAGVRLMGKRQVGELEPSELVLSLIIAPKEYLDGDNPSHYHEMREPIRVWRCGDCDWWTSAARPIGNKCGRCGSKNIIEPKRQR